MGDRARTRLQAVGRAFAARWGLRALPRGDRERILVAHNLLLGDTLMLTPLFAKLRARHPDADLATFAAPAFVPLYARGPYGVRALPFRPSRQDTVQALWSEPAFDRAYVVGDNRYSWMAAALGAREIVAHASPGPFTRQLFVDVARPYAPSPEAWGDTVSGLVDGPEPPAYARGDWPAGEAKPFDAPKPPYAVLHVGASTPLKQWPAERWRAVARALVARGYAIAWSAGRGEEALVSACEPDPEHANYAGRLDLPQLRALIEGAALAIAPDTGIAHLARVAWTPSVTIFGPGSATLCGTGRFWREVPWRAVHVDPFECRDQTILFGRDIAWARRCGRSTAECERPRCMEAVTVDAVLAAVDAVLPEARAAG